MSVPGRLVHHFTILDAKAANGVGNSINVRDFRNAVVKIGTASNANLTVKAQGSVSNFTDDYVAPNFAATQTVTNNWDYIQMIDLNNGAAIAGDTGIALTGTDDFRLFELNINGLDFINFRVSDYVAGSITVVVQLSNNA